jgi:CheY-like chemotaxis protein
MGSAPHTRNPIASGSLSPQMRIPEDAIILLIDDDENDIVLAKRALSNAQITNPLYVLQDGEEATQYLEGVGRYANRDDFPLPDLILLDLKMPKMDGFELLSWIRAQPHLKALRIVVLTTSEQIYDINKAYDLGANSFIVKPLEFENYQAMVRTLGSFWLNYSRAPKLDRQSPKEH